MMINSILRKSASKINLSLSRRKVAVLTSLIAFGLLSASGSDSIRMQPAVITLDSSITYQTITGWEASSESGQTECKGFNNYRNELFDRAVNELGINRLRVSIRSGLENSRDTWLDFQSGKINHSGWRSVRYSTTNDNDDPFNIDPSGFKFSELDNKIENVVLPIKERLEANGEQLLINVTYVAFTNQLGPGMDYLHDNPEEYAEFVLATYLHLNERYGWVPDYWEVILEPDNVSEWDGKLIGRAIVASAQRLIEHGFSPAFIAPSTKNMGKSISYFDDLISIPGAVDHLVEYSYHRYRGVSKKGLSEIAIRSTQLELNTAMLEHIGGDYRELLDDLSMGGVSSWQQFTLAFCNGDHGDSYYVVDDRDPQMPGIKIGSRARYLKQYFKYVRSGATRIGVESDQNNLSPLAFVNPDGRHVVVVAVRNAGSFSLAGLPEGNYGISYTTPKEDSGLLPDQRIYANQILEVNIPDTGVATVYQKEDVDTPPTLTSDLSNNHETSSPSEPIETHHTHSETQSTEIVSSITDTSTPQNPSTSPTDLPTEDNNDQISGSPIHPEASPETDFTPATNTALPSSADNPENEEESSFINSMRCLPQLAGIILPVALLFAARRVYRGKPEEN